MRPYTGRLVLAGLAGTAAELCGLGLVAAAAWLIARAAQQPTMAALSLAIVAVRGFALAKGSLRYVERLAGHDVALRALAELRGRVFDALAASPRSPAGRASGGTIGSTADAAAGDGQGRDGDALSRMVSDVDAVQDLLLRCLLPAVAAAACAVAGVTVAVLVLPAAAAALAAGTVAAGVLLPLAVWPLGRRAAGRAADARRRLAVRGLDVWEGAADLAVFGATGRFTDAAGRAARRLERAERTTAHLAGLVTAAGALLQGATVAAAVWLGVRAGAGQVEVAVVALTALVTVEATLPLAGAAQRLCEIAPACRRVDALLRTPPPGAPHDPLPLPSGPLSVELLGVHVTYPGAPPAAVPAASAATPGAVPAASGGRGALDGVDLQVERGRRVAVVGASGAGKSTLLAAVAGLVAPSAGTVTLAGHALERYAPGDVRAAVRGLTQDAHVFAGTVRANLLLARPDADEADLEAAARRARLLEVVRELPQGWDTVVGEGGRGLSGGQRQRLLLARALLADPPVLLLDEPTEALDTATADAVTRDLLTAPGGGTLLLVTHRLAALEAADEVLVVDGGRVVQRGRHDDLHRRPGPYRDLWEAERLASPVSGSPAVCAGPAFAAGAAACGAGRPSA
ncbi:thiol reductant ABC exporter subunit CydC [Spirillospora sp. NPDC127200]